MKPSLLTLALPLLIAIGQTASVQAADKPIERFTAIARAMGNIATGAAGRVNIGITRWTTPEEREMLAKTLVEEGTEELVDTLADQEKVGYIKFTHTLGYRLRYARQVKTENGRVIILATDRPILFGEFVRGGRTRDFDVSIIRLELDDEGKGEGKLAVAVEVTYDKESGSLQLKNYDSQPVRLLKVKTRK